MRGTGRLTDAVRHAVEEHPGRVVAARALHERHVVTRLDAHNGEQLEGVARDLGGPRTPTPRPVLVLRQHADVDRRRLVLPPLRVTVALENNDDAEY